MLTVPSASWESPETSKTYYSGKYDELSPVQMLEKLTLDKRLGQRRYLEFSARHKVAPSIG
jgi:hypothetical protein